MTTIELSVETWGERFNRAYRTSRREFGQDQVTYEKIAERLRQVLPSCTGTTIQRLAEHDEVPSRADQRVRAFFALHAMGYNPAKFGLPKEEVPLGALAFGLDRAIAMVRPVSRRYSRGETLDLPDRWSA